MLNKNKYELNVEKVKLFIEFAICSYVNKQRYGSFLSNLDRHTYYFEN